MKKLAVMLSLLLSMAVFCLLLIIPEGESSISIARREAVKNPDLFIGLSTEELVNRYGEPDIILDDAYYFKYGESSSILFGPEDLYRVAHITDGVVVKVSDADM